MGSHEPWARNPKYDSHKKINLIGCAARFYYTQWAISPPIFGVCMHVCVNVNNKHVLNIYYKKITFLVDKEHGLK